jgi:hypothetical protein
VDNLRRSLVPIALTLLLLVAWAALEPALSWTLFVIAIVVLPGALVFAAEVARKPREMALAQHCSRVRARRAFMPRTPPRRSRSWPTKRW